MNKFYITIICFILAIIGGTLFVFPKYQAVNVHRAQIIKAQQGILIARENTALFQEYRRKIEQDFGEELEKVEAGIPERVSLLSLLNFLQETAAHRGLRLSEIDSFHILDSTERPGMQETLLSFSLSGSYNGFKDFLRHIAESARLIAVQDINFSYQDEAHLDFTLTIKVYSY